MSLTYHEAATLVTAMLRPVAGPVASSSQDLSSYVVPVEGAVSAPVYLRKMPSLDRNQQELLAELRRLAGECERLSFEVARANQRQLFCGDPQGVRKAAREERDLLAKMSRLMDRRRAVEGHLMRVRGQLRSLRPHE
jgi:hypothetical protein